MTFLGLALGILMLLAGGTALVNGASQLAARFGIAPMLVGLTIVAIGTSTPELAVNVFGVVRGETDLAFGNVVGSNIANIALVLGLSALFRPITLQSGVVRRELPLLLLATIVLTIMALDEPFDGLPGIISRSDSLVLLALFGIFIYLSVLSVMRARQNEPLFQEVEKLALAGARETSRFAGFYIVLGILLLFGGGELTVRASIALAALLGLPMAVVGALIVAVGTSMPELVTSVIAAMRGESDLALGNVVGSNIFNALFVLPVSGLAGAIAVPDHGVTDLLFSLVLTAALFPVFFLGAARLGHAAGAVLLLAYAAWAGQRIFT